MFVKVAGELVSSDRSAAETAKAIYNAGGSMSSVEFSLIDNGQRSEIERELNKLNYLYGDNSNKAKHL